MSTNANIVDAIKLVDQAAVKLNSLRGEMESGSIDATEFQLSELEYIGMDLQDVSDRLTAMSQAL